MRYKTAVLAALALVAFAAIVATAVAAPRDDAGDCGQYRYWRDGQCTDARDRPSSKSWAEEMLAKPWHP